MKLKKKVKKYPNGGKAPIKGTKEQANSYADSVEMYNFYNRGVDRTGYKYVPVDEYINRVGRQRYLDKFTGTSSGRIIEPNAMWYKGTPEMDLYTPTFTKPVQPIIYQPETLTYNQVLQSNYHPEKNSGYVTNSLGEKFPKVFSQEQPINIQSFKADLLQGSDINMFNPIPFEKGTYFTRPKQGQEIGDRLEYFDKKTGHKLMQNGGNMNMYRDDGFNSLPQVFADGGINSYDVPAQMPTNSSFFQLPYNELATALMTKQKAYDTQEAEIAKNQAFLTDLKSGYRTSGLPQEIQKEYNSKFQNYIGQDLTDPNIKRSLVQDIANLKGDPRLRTLAADIKQSALWDAYQQAHPAEAGAAVNPYKQGEQWTPAMNPDGTWQNEQQVNNWYGNITPYADYNKMIDDLFGKVRENTKFSILEEDPTATFHTDKDGKEYYLSKKTGNKATYITPNLPQWQSAAEQAQFELTNSNSPDANYFKANYSDFISKDPNFIKDYISTAGGKFVYNREETSVNYDLKNAPGGSGKGTTKTDTDPTIAKYPLSVTTGKLTDENNQPIDSPIKLARVIQTTLGTYKDNVTGEVKNNFDKNIQSTANNLETSYGENYPGLEFKQTSPGSASITVINKNGGEIPTEVQIEVDRVNSKNELFLMKMNGLKDLNDKLMLDAGLDPNLSILDNLSKEDNINYQRAYSDALLKTIGGDETGIWSDFKYFLNDPTGIGKRFTMNSVKQKVEEKLESNPEMKKLFNENLNNNINRFITNDKVKKYLKNINEVLNGVEMLNNDAIPIGEAIKPGTKQNTLMTVLNTALTDNVMLSDGQYVKYANKPDEKISEDDKKIVANYFSKNNTNQTGTDKSSLEHLAKRTYLYFDENENEYKLAVVIPRSENISDGNIYLEVSPKAVKNIEQFAADTDPDFHNLKLQGYNNTFFQNLKETNGTLAYAPVPDGDFRRRVASETGKKESELQNYQICVKRVLNPTQITQNNGEIYNLTPGSFYFTVGEFPNAILEPKNAKSIFEFNNLYNKLKAQYNDNIPNSKIQELVNYINSSPGLQINTIYSNKDYRKLQTYTKVNSPK